jgi:hypothetical protein
MEQTDLRPKDIDFLSKNNVFDWDTIWENSLHKHSIPTLDTNQRGWHLSRMSYLAGFLVANGKSESDVEQILDEYYLDLNIE